jgi:hypothetical protein
MPNTSASVITHLRNVDTHLILSDFQDSSKDLTEQLISILQGIHRCTQRGRRSRRGLQYEALRLYISLQNAERRRFTRRRSRGKLSPVARDESLTVQSLPISGE